MTPSALAVANLFAGLPTSAACEEVVALLSTPHLRIEHIVSTGQASPPGFWYDQEWAEWVVLLRGAATVRFANEDAPRRLDPGDYLHIPAHAHHRVEWTAQGEATVWLAIHYCESHDNDLRRCQTP